MAILFRNGNVKNNYCSLKIIKGFNCQLPGVPFYAGSALTDNKAQHWLYFVISLSPLNNSSLAHSDHSSLSTSLSFPPLSLPNHSRSSSFRAKKLGNFVLQFSAAAQDQALDETPVLEAEPLEFSDTRLLAQNVPWHCTPEDIRTVFEKYGTVVDVELAMYDKTRNRGLAFVTMGSPEEARTALDNLESSEMEGRVIKMAYARPKKTKIPPPSSQPKPITFNLYVENLPYEARSKDLKELFDSEDYNVLTAEIVFQNNPQRSTGYGFVGFKTKTEAEAALSASHRKVIFPLETSFPAAAYGKTNSCGTL